MRSITLWAICLALLSSSVFCDGDTIGNEPEEFYIIQSAFIQFQKDNNRFPTSWDDLWDSPASGQIVESLHQRENFGRKTDTIESFRFIAPGTTIQLPRKGGTVIGMMIRPMRPPPDEKRRYLIVRLEDGTRGVKKMSEESLRKRFSEIGLNLDDYTGPNGNWAPETRLRPLSEIPSSAETVTTDSSMNYNTIPPLPFSKMLSTARKQQLSIAGGIALFLLIAIGVRWLILKASRSKM